MAPTTVASKEKSTVVLNQNKIREEIRKMGREVQKVINISEGKCIILLQKFYWNLKSLLKDHENAGHTPLYLRSHGVCQQDTQVVDNGECSICCDEVSVMGFECEHFACSQCWKQYLDMNIDKPRIGCIDPECLYVVCSDSLEELGGDVEVQAQVIRNDYVERSPNIVWCPSKNCQLAVKSDSFDTVECQCGLLFCFQCRLDSHVPATCTQVRNWETRENFGFTADEKSFAWILKRTKDCPKCMSPIEKQGGCSHMCCRKCYYSFCWHCGGWWFEHGMACRQIDLGLKRLGNQSNKRSSLYFSNLYKKHSVKLEREKLLRYKLKGNTLNVLLQSRRTLMYSIIFEFYFYGNGFKEFKTKQKELETSVDDFSTLMRLRRTENIKLEEVLDYELCFNALNTKFKDEFKEYRWMAFNYTTTRGIDYFKNLTDTIFFNTFYDVGRSDDHGIHHAVMELEHVVPEQKQYCCANFTSPRFNLSNVFCVFGPEGTLDSWFEKIEGTPGEECVHGYENNDGLCALIPATTSTISTTLPETTTTEPLTLPESTVTDLETSTSTTKFSETTELPIHLESRDHETTEMTKKLPGTTGLPIHLESQDHKTTEMSDLEKRVQKYRETETDGDEPDVEKEDEDEYYDDSSSSIFSFSLIFVILLFFES
uniref:RBR-type E3 ubiquitin transferase n=1 Tax=Caenorhabditis tropicalis TaxID=1561998 RepID=A0A1I7T1I9_9PELO